jgi:transcriptional regulator with XRE-family HTH domain
MSPKDTFGLRLRVARERRGVSLAEISAKTKVPVAVWEAMERNDFSRWPSGLFARAYVRDFAGLAGLDPVETVDEFCRHFPNGDRRRGDLIRGQAEALNIPSGYEGDDPPAEGDRRLPASAPAERPRPFRASLPVLRALGIIADLAGVAFTASVVSGITGTAWLPVAGAVSLVYSSLGTACLGRSPGVALAQSLAVRLPQLLDINHRRLSPRAHARPL